MQKYGFPCIQHTSAISVYLTSITEWSMIFYSDLLDISWSNDWIPIGDNVHVHGIPIHDNNILEKKNHLVTNEEREKYFRFRKQEDAVRFLTGRLYTKELLAQYLSVTIDEILIVLGKYNKPQAVDKKGRIWPLQFNISHSGQWVLIAVCKKSVGIDVEQILPIDYQSVANEVFSDGEKEYIHNGLGIPEEKFYKLWTRKEAVLKARGTGMIDDLRQLEVLDNMSSVEARSLDEIDFKVLTFNVDNHYIGSVCFHATLGVNFYLVNG